MQHGKWIFGNDQHCLQDVSNTKCTPGISKQYKELQRALACRAETQVHGKLSHKRQQDRHLSGSLNT